jgi:F0F1-type ATP synthase membrane subunit c/vacuolar-type H+-ATPase subunit K
MAILPFAFRTGTSNITRAGIALGLAAIVVALWIGGLFAANVQFLCRLF